MNIFKYRDNGKDDGYREYTDDGYCLCNRCKTVMMFREDMDVTVSYYECPQCGFIEIDEYYDEDEGGSLYDDLPSWDDDDD